MKETNIYCDHCGKALDTMLDYADLTIEASHIWTPTDLCAECFDKLCKVICDFCKKGGE